MGRLWPFLVYASVIIVNIETDGKFQNEQFQRPHISSTTSGFIKVPQNSMLGTLGIQDSPHLKMYSYPADNVTDPCKAIMEHIAIEGGNFTHCMLGNARPFRVCETCVASYTRFSQLVDDLGNDERCSTRLLMADKMQIIMAVSNTFDTIWNNAYCSKCFSNILENVTTGEVTFNFTSDVLWFQEMQINITRCFNDSSDWDWTGEGPSNTSDVCKICKPAYLNMNKHFSDLQNVNNKQVCMDVTDMMNKTRLRWSTEFNCSRDQPDGIGVFVVTALLAASVVTLYIFTGFYFRVKKLDVYKTKRMKRQPNLYGSFEASRSLLPSSQRNGVLINNDDGADDNSDMDASDEVEEEDARPTVLG